MGKIIQGVFPRGFSSITQRSVPSQQRATPQWVAQRIAFGNRPSPHSAPLPVQRHVASPNMTAVEMPASRAAFPAAGGQPLPVGVRQAMESFFGTTFDDVRIHVGPEAAAIGALAFTQGAHIHFAPGQYNPATPQGRQILGHELAHVLQQRTGRVRNPFGNGVAVVQDTIMEAEADRLGRAAAMHHAAVQAKLPPAARMVTQFGAVQLLVSQNAKDRITAALATDHFGNYDTEMAKLQQDQRDAISAYWDAHGAGKSNAARGRAAAWMAGKIKEYLRAGVITYSNNFDTKHTIAVLAANSAKVLGNARAPKPAFNTVLKTSYLVGKIIAHAATQADGNDKLFTEAASVAGAANISLAQLHVAHQDMKTVALGIYQYTVTYDKATDATNQTVTLNVKHLATA